MNKFSDSHFYALIGHASLQRGLAKLSTSASERVRCLNVDSAEQREARLRKMSIERGKQLATDSIEKERRMLSLTTEMQL